MLWLFRSCFKAPEESAPPSLLELVIRGDYETVKACIDRLQADNKLDEELNPRKGDLPLIRIFKLYNPENRFFIYECTDFDIHTIYRYDLVIILLKAGAKTYWENSSELTPYHVAAQYNHLSFFMLLMWFETEEMPYEKAWERGKTGFISTLFSRWEYRRPGITRIIKQTAIDFREAKRCVKEAIRIERLNPLEAIKLYNKASDIFLLYMSKEDGADNPSKAPVVAFYKELADQYLAKARALRAAITDAVYDDPAPTIASSAQALNMTTASADDGYDPSPSVF